MPRTKRRRLPQSKARRAPSRARRVSKRPVRRNPRLFLCASLASPADRLRNEGILRTAKQLGFDVYAPHVELPIGSPVKSGEILLKNVEAVKSCDLVLAILENAGPGVFLELGVAFGVSRPVVLYRPRRYEGQGRMDEGAQEIIGTDGLIVRDPQRLQRTLQEFRTNFRPRGR